MLADLFAGKKIQLLSFYLSLFALAGCSLITYGIYDTEIHRTFSGMFVGDEMSNMLKLMIYPTVAAVFVYSRSYLSLRGLLRGEFFSLALFATLGMMVMVSASHLITLYLGLELLSLSLYAMVALQRNRLLRPKQPLNSLFWVRWPPGFCFMACQCYMVRQERCI